VRKLVIESVTRVMQHGDCAVMLSAEKGHIEVTKLLLAAGADLQEQDEVS
jgi:ankyrin repeat protein